MNSRARLMVVEDEAIVAFNLEQQLTRLGYDVTAVAASGADALRLAHETRPDLILMDIRIEGDIDGIETAQRINASCPTPVVYLTAYSEDSTLDRARATEPYGYLLKPFSEREVHATIQMALQRHVTEMALQVSEERLRLALDASGMGVWDLDTSSRDFTFVGRAARLFGMHHPPGSIAVEALLECVDPADRESVRAGLELSQSAMAVHDLEFRRLVESGETRWTKAVAKPHAGHDGSIQRIIGVVQDINERRLNEEKIRNLNIGLERLVDERTAELRESVNELDAFSYTVAHDLRAPVRAILGFAELLREELGDHIDGEVGHYLDRVRNAGHQMGELIDALLSLSRISRSAMVRLDFDLSDLAGKIAAELQEDHPDRNATFAIEPGLHVNADPGLMLVVMENLLRNAWKFTAKHASARIEFGQRDGAEGRVFFVRDDGAGFDMHFADKLFGVFQRLHTSSEFEGSGIGLATVRRIILRHGGRIWAEGQPERGATIYFTIAG